MKIFTDIGEMLTLQGADKKGGRHVLEADLSIVTDAILVSDQGKVVFAGPKSQFKDTNVKAERISLKGQTVLPAFLEPHTHLIFAGNRAHEFEWRMQGQTYQEISAKGGGIRYTVEQTRKAGREELQTLAQARANRFLRQGVTTLEVKSGYGLDLETEKRSLEVARGLKGPRIVTTYLGAHSKSPEFPDLETYLKMICDQVMPEIAAKKLADRVDIYIEGGFFTKEQAKTYFSRARELGLGITAHVEQLSDSGGIEAALAFQPQSLDHVVFASDQAVVKLAKANTTAVLLPTSDMYLRMQYPPARKMIDAGVRVALSTDFNPGTSPTQDLSLVGVLARLEMKMSLAEVISAYTLGAAFALGKESELGSLTPGKQCDFISLSGSWRDLFYAVGEHPVSQVFKSSEAMI
ncbi:MAG: imidazolonepropionase [Bdellovibrionales bacterium]